MKTIKTMLAFLMVISMIAPAMADVTAYASGYASSSDSAYAQSSASVSYTGVLTEGDAGAMSGAYGSEYASSYSGAGGSVYPFYSANVYAYTEAYADPGSAWAMADTGGEDIVGAGLLTDVEVNSYAAGDTASVYAEVDTIASWDLPGDYFGSGIMSNGAVGADATGSYVESGYWYNLNYAYAEGDIATTMGTITATGTTVQVGQFTNAGSGWAYADNWGYAYGSSIDATVTAIAELD